MVVTDLLTSDKSPEGLILSVIKDNPNVSTKQIYNKITKQGISIRYHKVYEKVQDMTKRNVLIKIEKTYTINATWIEKKSNFFHDMQSKNLKITEDSFKHVSQISQAKILKFDTFEDFTEFWNKIRKKFVNSRDSDNKDVIMWLGTHAFVPLLYTKDRIDALSMVRKKNIKYNMAIRGNSKMDESMLDFYKQQGIESVRIGVDDCSKQMIHVYNDTVLILLENEILDEINKFCDEMTDVTDFRNQMKLCDLIKKSVELNAIMIRDKKIAKYHKNMIHALIHSVKKP
jgi:hypothetical protein